MISRIFVVTIVPVIGTGCLHFAHPLPKCPVEEWRETDLVSDASKSCIYLFLINGPDPLGYCNLSGVKDYLAKQGFTKCYFGHSHQETYFLQKIRHIHGNCRPAQFVIVGFDSGAGSAQSLARKATGLGIPIDLLVLLDPRGCSMKQDSDPSRTIVIQGGHTWLGRTPFNLGETYRISTCSKWEIPTHPETLNLICHELTQLAAKLPPPPRPQNPTEPLIKKVLPPRETPPQPKPLPAEWDFLKFRDSTDLPNLDPSLKKCPETEHFPSPKIE